MSDTPQGRFPKSAHLLKHSDFQKVYQQGRRHFSGNMTVFYLRTGNLPIETGAAGGKASAGEAATRAGAASASSSSPRRWAGGVRIGFTVPKTMGGAVQRNRMRRRTREAVRHQLSLLTGMSCGVDIVINPKKGLLQAEFAQISQEIERAFTVVHRASTSGGEAEPSKRSGADKTKRSGAVTKQRSAADAMKSTKQEARPQ